MNNGTTIKTIVSAKVGAGNSQLSHRRLDRPAVLSG
jgi:hypothetical protein